MTAPVLDLRELERELLIEVRDERVAFSRNRYYLNFAPRRNIQREVQRLRAMKLVVLKRWDGRGRIPVTRMCELTDTGRSLVQQLTGDSGDRAAAT